MRINVELSKDLLRRTKALAARRGCKLRDLIEEGLLYVLESSDMVRKKSSSETTLSELMKDACGIGGSGVNDLATNPKHMEGFGRD